MFIKLQYTTGKSLATFFRVLNEIVNDSTLTSISLVQAKATSASWHTSLTTNMDWTNCQLYRTGSGTTALTSNTTSHIARPAATSGNDSFEWVLRQKVYDASTFYYSAYSVATTGGAGTFVVGNGVTNAFSSSGWDVTVDTTQSTAQGTLLTTTGTSGTFAASVANAGAFTMYAFITDNTLLFTFTTSTGTYSTMGYPSLATLSNVSYFLGPMQVSQYTRRDYWNTDSNGIIPIMFNNPARTSQGLFGNVANDWTAAHNSVSATTTENPYSIYNCYEMAPNNVTTWSKITYSQVVWGVGNRYSDIPMTGTASTATATAQCYGAFINNTSQYRVLLPALTGTRGYALLPLTFKRNGMLGGNVTDKSGYYLFNGDYFPGDEFTYGGKTYHIIPGHGTCQANRLGWAVPKE